MLQQAAPLVDVFPREEKKILLEHPLDVGVAKFLADGAAMLVIDDAGRLIHRFPAAFPGEVAEVGVFEIEGREDFVESAELEKFTSIECAGTTAAIGAGIEIPNLFVGAMANAERTLLPPRFSEAC